MSDRARVEFLSDEWLAALGDAIAASLPADSSGSITLGQVVTDTEPTGDEVRYTLLIGPGPNATVTTGSTDEAEVVLRTSYAAARALARGDSSAAALLEQGLVKISGDARRLVDAADLLGAIGESLTELRDRTVFR
jgi:hypothetical protein